MRSGKTEEQTSNLLARHHLDGLMMRRVPARKTLQAMNTTPFVSPSPGTGHWIWVLLLGIVFIVAGLLCLASPGIAGLAVEIVVAVSLLLTGLIEVLVGMSLKGLPGRSFLLISGTLALATGMLILTHPFAGLFALTLYIAISFLGDGLIRLSMVKRMGGFGRHPLWIPGAILSIVIGSLILFNIQQATGWVLGTLCGIGFLMTGIGSCAAALAWKHATAD